MPITDEINLILSSIEKEIEELESLGLTKKEITRKISEITCRDIPENTKPIFEAINNINSFDDIIRFIATITGKSEVKQ